MNLYRVTYREWNTSFSDMYKCEKLSVGENKDEAIERVKKVAAKDARYFEASKITSVFGHKVMFEDDNIQKMESGEITIETIASDMNKQNIFDMVIEEACRQWCSFVDEAPERKDGEGFAKFFYEVFKDKEQEYTEAYDELNQPENEGINMV